MEGHNNNGFHKDMVMEGQNNNGFQWVYLDR